MKALVPSLLLFLASSSLLIADITQGMTVTANDTSDDVVIPTNTYQEPTDSGSDDLASSGPGEGVADSEEDTHSDTTCGVSVPCKDGATISCSGPATEGCSYSMGSCDSNPNTPIQDRHKPGKVVCGDFESECHLCYSCCYGD